MINKTLPHGIFIALFFLLHYKSWSQNTKQDFFCLKNYIASEETVQYNWLSRFENENQIDFSLIHPVDKDAAESSDGLFQQNTIEGLKLISSSTSGVNAVVFIPFSTAYDDMNVQDVMNLMQSLYDRNMNAGNRCYVITPQPRGDGKYSSAEERHKLSVIKDSILIRFGDQSINFWDGLCNPEDYSLLSAYDAGDRLHLNKNGQDLLYERVLDKNVFRLQSKSLHSDIKSGKWFDVVSPCILYFAVFPDLIKKLQERINEPAVR
jgi:hypothetical protein